MLEDVGLSFGLVLIRTVALLSARVVLLSPLLYSHRVLPPLQGSQAPNTKG